MIDRQTTELGKRLRSFFRVAPSDQESRRLRQEQHAAYENYGPGELNRDWNPISTSVVASARRVVHDSSQKKTDSDCPLVAAYDGTSDPLGRRFALV